MPELRRLVRTHGCVPRACRWFPPPPLSFPLRPIRGRPRNASGCALCLVSRSRWISRSRSKLNIASDALLEREQWSKSLPLSLSTGSGLEFGVGSSVSINLSLPSRCKYISRASSRFLTWTLSVRSPGNIVRAVNHRGASLRSARVSRVGLMLFPW